jgi:hypothetical protein
MIAEIFEQVVIKLFSVVDRYLFWHPESTDYVLPEKLLECVLMTKFGKAGKTR